MNRLFTSKPLTKEVTLSTTDTLKLLLTTQSGSTAARPHQAHLLLTTSSGLETAYPLIVKHSGRAILNLSPSELPVALLAQPLKASIVIGSFGEAKPLLSEIFTLKVEEDKKGDLPTYTAPERYAAKPEIHHIFRPDQKSPPKIISLVFTLAVLATIPLLFGSWLLLGSNLNGLGSAMKTAPIAHSVFFGSLVAMEGIFAMYYLSWKLFKVLPIAGAVGVVACISGAKALSEVQKRRVAGQR